MTKHTSEPWEVTFSLGGGCCVDAEMDVRYVINSPNDDVSIEEAQANAQLIEVAPDLFREAETIIGHVDMGFVVREMNAVLIPLDSFEDLRDVVDKIRRGGNL